MSSWGETWGRVLSDPNERLSVLNSSHVCANTPMEKLYVASPAPVPPTSPSIWELGRQRGRGKRDKYYLRALWQLPPPISHFPPLIRLI